MTGMEFFIRPRQDFTLSRMADALHCLSYCGFYPAMYDSIEKGKRIVVISIEVVGDWKQDVLEAIKALVDMEHFNEDDFKIIEQSPAEVAVTEVF